MVTSPLRVGMNLLWLRPGQVGGSEVAAVATAQALDEHAVDAVELHLYAQTSFVDAHRELSGRLPIRTVGVPTGSLGARVALESTWLPGAVRRDRIDVVHCYGGVVPPGLRRPSVVTIHDVQPLEDGLSFGASSFSPVKRRWLSATIPRSVTVAAQVIVPSAFVRDRLVDLVPVDPDKITVIGHGWNPRTTRQADPAAIRRRFGLAGPFALFPAITYPHKNHVMLIEAFARMTRSDVVLVLTGGTGPCEHDVMRSIERFGLGERVRRVGRVTPGELDALVAEAAVLAFPSRYEGFGLPVLEALAVDTPVIASSAGSLPEVLGDAGLLVDPDDTDGWARALADAFDGRFVSEDASKRRRAMIEPFSWERLAPRFVEAYRRAARRPEEGLT